MKFNCGNITTEDGVIRIEIPRATIDACMAYIPKMMAGKGCCWVEMFQKAETCCSDNSRKNDKSPCKESGCC